MPKPRLRRLGVQLGARAPGSARASLSAAVLRTQRHALEEHLRTEGVQTTFARLLAEATFAGNALASVGQVTPYQALRGRRPALLPPMPDARAGGEASECGDRAVGRVRELAVRNMVQASAPAQMSRALRAKTPAPGTGRFTPCGLVDYFRP